VLDSFADLLGVLGMGGGVVVLGGVHGWNCNWVF
jgi:hypothetical protein